MKIREACESLIIVLGAIAILWVRSLVGPEHTGLLIAAVLIFAFIKTGYYFFETLRYLVEATAVDMPYYRFVLLMAYNMAQITCSFSLDFYCLQRIDATSLEGVAPELGSWELLFECFYFSVLNFSFFGYGSIMPVHIPGKVVMLLEVVTAFSTVIFLLSDFVSMKESMQRRAAKRQLRAVEPTSQSESRATAPRT